MCASEPGVEDDFDILTIPTACRCARCGRTFVYQEIRAGRLRAIKLGRLTRIRRRDYEEWLASMPPLVSTAADGVSGDSADPAAVVSKNANPAKKMNGRPDHNWAQPPIGAKREADEKRGRYPRKRQERGL